MVTIDTTNMCSHLQRKLFEEDGIYHPLWMAMQDDSELTAVVRSRQRFLPDVVPGETIYSEEFEEEIDPIAHEKQYLGELKDIRKIADSFDVVMFPIDGRIGNGYTLGGRQFIERFKVGLFVPMHFVASGFESAWRMKEFTDEKGIPFWEISREGETIEI
jgi:hypothetical protein